MALGTTLGTMIAMLRAETGASTNQSMGVNQVDPLMYILRRHYEFYHEDFDWPQHLLDNDEEILAGERYYTFNDEVAFKRITNAWVLDSGTNWIPLAYGISPVDYSAINSEAGEVSDPILKWQHYGDNQFEVWPIAASNTSLRFRGYKKPAVLNSLSSVCDIDDQLIVLAAAAEILARNGAKDAEIKLGLANRRYAQLKGQNSKVRVMEMGMQSRTTDPSGGRINYWRRAYGPTQPN